MVGVDDDETDRVLQDPLDRLPAGREIPHRHPETPHHVRQARPGCEAVHRRAEAAVVGEMGPLPEGCVVFVQYFFSFRRSH